MRHILVPPLIGQQHAAGRLAGSFDAVCLFVDTSGFTPLTTAMMAHGVEGAEAVADALAAVFEPLAAAVYAYGGFIAAFAGDAFKAIFPLDQPDAHRRAAAAAWEIRSQMASRRQVPTPFGVFDVAVKATIADGEVVWGIWQRAEGQKAEGQKAMYWFDGEGLARCLEADPLAAAGEVILTDAVLRRLIDDGLAVAAEPVDGYWRLERLEASAAAPPSLRALHAADEMPGATWFYPAELLSMPVRGEFRRVVTVFLNLPDMPEDSGFADALLRLLAHYRGYLCRVGRIGERDRGATLLLFWGAPASHENDLALALGFVLDLRQAHPAVLFRAGVTTGQAFAGFSGSAQREEYTCHGVTVNLAARLMVTAGWGEVWLDEETARQAQGQFDLNPTGRRQLKGFAEPRSLFRLAGRRETGEAALYRGAMVGRQSELDQITMALAPLAEHRFAGVITILGEAGLGKSRLAYALKELSLPSRRFPVANRGLSMADAESSTISTSLPIDKSQLGTDPKGVTIGDFSWFFCPCDDVLHQSLDPFRYWLRRFFGQSGGAGEEQNKARFEQTLDQLIVATPEPALAAELQRTRSVVGALLDLRWVGSLYEQLEPQGRFENTLLALKALVKAESLHRPLVLHVEDAHWLDADSRQFLTRLAHNVAGYPFAVLLTARPELEPLTLPAGSPQHTVFLNALTAADLGTLAGEVLGQPVEPALMTLLAERAEGNPFFAEQLLLFLQERRLLLPSPGGLASAARAEGVPLDVQAVLVARIDRLAAEVRRVVQTAAVLGREFELNLLMAMLDDDPLVVDRVTDAETAAVWTQLSELRYLFRHALLRDAAYEMQLVSVRRDLHRLAGESIEALHAHDLVSRSGQLAYHYERAGLADKAQMYLEQAGDRARDQYQNTAALDYYERLLRMLRASLQSDGDILTAQQPEALVDAMLKHAAVLRLIGRWSDAEHELAVALELAEHAGLRLQHAHIQLQRSVLYRRRGDLAAGLRCAEDAVAYHRTSGDAAGLGAAVNQLGVVYWRQGALNAAQACHQEALDLYRRSDHKHGIAASLSNLANVAMYRNELGGALEYLQEALALELAYGRRVEVAMRYQNLGIVYHNLDDHSNAMACYEQSLVINREIGHRSGVARALGNLATVYQDLGDHSEALRLLEEAKTIDGELGNRLGVAWHECNQAWNHMLMGQVDRSLELIKGALGVFKESGAKLMLAAYTYLQARVALEARRYGEAETANAEARRLATEAGHVDILFETDVVVARLLAVAGAVGQAVDQLDALLRLDLKPSQRAAASYEVWRIDPSPDRHRAALQHYTHLAARSPKIEYHSRLHELRAVNQTHVLQRPGVS